MRIGLFGGTFDPLHIGHLIMAQDAAEAGSLDRVLFLPAGVPPLKPAQPQASANDRLNMVNEALHDTPIFQSNTVDLNHDSTCYSVDTVRQIQKDYPDDQLYWILGTDQLAQLHKWRNIEELTQIVEFIVLNRPGIEIDPRKIPPHTHYTIAPTHSMNISSSEIRERLRNGQTVKYFLHPAVLTYIKAKNLYTR